MSDHELMLPLGIIENTPGFEDFDRMLVEGHTSFMRQADEPSLLEMASSVEHHVYRFVWIRALDLRGPVLIRLTIQNNGTALAVIKIWREVPVQNTTHNYPQYQRVLQTHKQKTISRRQVNKFLRQMEKVGFWEIPTWNQDFGGDGETWKFEGVRAGQFHFVMRWVPADKAFIDAGLLLLRLCGLRGWAWNIGSISRQWDKNLEEFFMDLLVRCLKLAGYPRKKAKR